MRRAVYLDFSIPLFEKESDLNSFSNHFKDISRYIDKTNNTKFYVSLTLEFISTFKVSIKPLIESIRKLVKEDRVQFVIKDSFQVDSLNFIRSISEFNFIFNEYLVGYYFGDKRNFEGDPSIMIKNLVNIAPFSGTLSLKDVEFLKGLGYSTFLVSSDFLKDSSYIYNGSIFLEVDFSFKKLFNTFLEKSELDNYILHRISNNYLLYHINPYELFLSNPESFNINASNLFHLLDLTDKIEFRFADEYFEMPVLKELSLLKYNNISKTELSSLQDKLANFMKLELPQDMDLSMFEEYKTASLWDSTGNSLIDEYLRTSFLMLTLLSSSIENKLDLLNKHLVVHLTTILDELENYSKSNQNLKEAIESYKEYINQK
jgi:hypothetical protein